MLNAQIEVPAQAVTLLDKKAYVNYKPIRWNYKDDGTQLILPIRFRTRSIDGRLITLSVQGTEDIILNLTAFIDNGAIVVDLSDSNGKLIRKTRKQLPGANDGAEHSMSIQLNFKNKILKVIYGEGTIDSYDFIDDIRIENHMQLAITTGASGESDGIIGCVTIVGLTIGDRFVFELEELKHSDMIRDKCDTLCTDKQCNKGTCVDLFHTTVCDCRGTYQSGKECDEVMQTLNVSWDQYISYTMDSDESQPTIISIDFKTDVKEGLIIHGTILSLGTNEPLGKLKLALIYGQLRLTIANLAEISFDNITLDNHRFNQILLVFEYSIDMVRMTFNGDTKSASLNTDDNSYHIKFGNELFFCAGDIEVGLSGCLRGIYVDYFDVINGYAKSSSKVKANAQLQSCDRNNLAEVRNSASEILPLVITDKKTFDGITAVHTDSEYEFSIDHENVVEHHDDKQMKPDGIFSKDDDDGKHTNFKESNPSKVKTESSKKQLCENDEAINCKNSVECVKENDQTVCVCRKGFVGVFCQFSTIPWNCDEILRAGNAAAGTYIIDPDGSGLLPETYAYCENGKTIITHNMPNNTLIHGKDLGDIHMIVNYKLFDDELLLNLMKHSESCKQEIRYNCDSAPLQFDKMSTWFTSITNEFVAGFGGVDGTCLCQGGKCEKCNCDSGGIATDYGTMSDSQVPIRNIYSLNEPFYNKGYMSLGPLVCTGSVGRSATYTMKIRKQFSPVEIGTWNGGMLNFEFRTYLESATLLSSNSGMIMIAMIERTFYLIIDNQISLALIPQLRKNNGHWHRITVDFRDGSVRFSIDDTVTTAVAKKYSFNNTQLSIGGGRDGFLGCIRQIFLNDKLITINKTLQDECENQCELHDCQHESRCEEDFITDTKRCVCQNAIIHSGHLCQNSINYGTEVSFHDPKQAFLKAQNINVSNALMQRIIFSFRTDQRDALLIYLHDHFYNFVQVHLSDHSHLVLTLNFNRTVYRCEVLAKTGNEYNRMKWIQVMVFQWSDSIELNVNDEICQITGQRILSNDLIRKFEINSDIDDVIQPPVSPVSEQNASFNHQYNLLFIGGVPTEIHFGNLEPIYRSTISNLLGCMRGLMIGTRVIDMREEKNWSYYPMKPGAIKFGCKMGCHEIEHLCSNDGHCSVEWVATKYSENTVTCNCARTSYYGEYCDQDSGAHFAGNSIMILNTAEIFEKVIIDWNQIIEQTFSFAFSTKPLEITSKLTKTTKAQTLATIHFKQNKIMQILLCKNGSVNVAITSRDASFVYTFPYNYSDGYRHYFYSRFRINKSLKITIDSWNYNFPSYLATGLSLANAIRFSFGGPYIMDISEMKRGDKKIGKHNFTGCISNIDIDVNVARMRLKPILYLKNFEHEFAHSLTIIGDQLKLDACNAFLIPGSLPPVLNTVAAPLWDSQFFIEPYKRPSDNDNNHNIVETDESKWWIMPLIILVISLIILFVIYLLLKHKQRQSTPSENPKTSSKDPENSPLIPANNGEKRSLTIKNDFILPEPDQHFDTIHSTVSVKELQLTVPENTTIAEIINSNEPSANFRVSNASGISGMTAYFTANTEFDNDDDHDYEDLAHDPQATDDDNNVDIANDGDNVVDNNCLDDTLTNCDDAEELVPSGQNLFNFGRNLMERKSTFRRSDSTAPTNSPLYKSPTAEKRKLKAVAAPCSPSSLNIE